MPEARGFARIAAADTASWLAAHPGALLLDVRDASAHERGCLPGAIRLDGRNHEPLLLREPRERPVFVYCYHGNASQTFAQMFADFGFVTVADLVGGWAAWSALSPSAPAGGSEPSGEAR